VGGDSGSGEGDSLRVKVLVSEELSSVEESESSEFKKSSSDLISLPSLSKLGGTLVEESELSESDSDSDSESESDSSLELTGGMVSSDCWAESTVVMEVMDWYFHFPRNVVECEERAE